MKIRIENIAVYLIGILIVLYSCANPMVPQGGPKDETPPELIYSIPLNGSLNFHGTTVDLTFDEAIQVTALKNELIITPTYTGEFDFKAKKYGVTVSFDKPFNDSTTYTLNFRNSIKDITESNPAENLILAFSTWDYLDSLSLNGKIYELLTDKPVQEYVVGIYAENDTLSPFNSPPLYFSKTDEFGKYSLNNIKADNYKIYAFNDKNDNLTIESKSEMYGFLGESIKLDSSLIGIDIGVINLDLTDLDIASARQNGKYYEIKASKYITDYQMTTPNSDSLLYSKYLADHKGILLYNTFHIKDSLEIIVSLHDSLSNNSIDTLFISYQESKRQPDDFTFSITSAEIHKENKTFDANIAISKPIEQINFDSLFIEWDSTMVTRFDSSNLKFQFDPLRIHIFKEITQAELDSIDSKNSEPLLYLKPASLISIENDSSLNKSLTIKLLQASELGIVRGSINLDSISFFVQLIDEKNSVVRSIYNEQDYSFNDVSPATYRLRLLIDENNDGIWSPGNINLGIPPESVFYYYDENGNKELILRANWELIDIDINSLDKYVDKEIDVDNESETPEN